MDLHEQLRRRRTAIVRQWIDETLAVYPEESAKFLRETKDRFANPAGRTIAEGIEYLFDALVDGTLFDGPNREETRADDTPRAELDAHLDRIVKITCIQDVSASGAVAFVFRLKGVLRRELASELEDPAFAASCMQLESRIDQLALFAFDSFAGVQQRLADIRVREVQRRVSTLMKMAQLNWEDLPTGEEPRGGSG